MRLAALVALTAMVLALHHFGPRRTLDIQTSDQVDAIIYDDRAVGGRSVAELFENPLTGFRCQLLESQTYKYCGYNISFTQSGPRSGESEPVRDLSQFTELLIELDYQGPYRYVPLALRTRLDPKAGEEPSAGKAPSAGKEPSAGGEPSAAGEPSAVGGPSELEPFAHAYFRIRREALDEPYKVQLSAIRMSTQWMMAKKISGEYSRPALDKVGAIGIQLPSSFPPGDYSFAIKRLEFIGPWISTDGLYRVLFFGWAFVIISLSVYQFTRMLRQNTASKERIGRLAKARERLLNTSKELEELAKRDELTGLLNRKGLESLAGERLSHLDKLQYSLLVIDLDHFKSINDTYGHPDGDRMLAVTGRCIQSQIREADIAARWGGEEFLVCCPDTSETEATVVAEKIRESLAAYRDSEQPNLKLSASIGIAQHRSEEDFSTTLARADKALYEAKQRGRNTYVVADA